MGNRGEEVEDCVRHVKNSRKDWTFERTKTDQVGEA